MARSHSVHQFGDISRPSRVCKSDRERLFKCWTGPVQEMSANHPRSAYTGRLTCPARFSVLDHLMRVEIGALMSPRQYGWMCCKRLSECA